MMARRSWMRAVRSASACASFSRSLILRGGALDAEDEAEADPEAPDADAPVDVAPAAPTSADFVDGEISGSFSMPAAAETTQQQAIRVRRERMKYPEVTVTVWYTDAFGQNLRGAPRRRVKKIANRHAAPAAQHGYMRVSAALQAAG